MKRKFIKLLFIFSIIGIIFTGCKRNKNDYNSVEISMCGSYYGDYNLNPYTSTKKLIAQQILLNIAKEYKSADDISNELSVNKIFIEDELMYLKKADLVKEYKGKFIAKGIIIGNEDKKTIKPFVHQIAEQISEIIIEELDSLKLAYNKCSFNEQSFTWEEMKSLFVYTQLLDLNLIDRGFLKHNITSGNPPIRKNLGEFFIHGIEGEPLEKYPVSHNICAIDSGGCAILFCNWNDKNLHPSKIRFSDDDLILLISLYNREKTERELIDECNLNEEDVQGSLKKLVKLGIISDKCNIFKTVIPVYYSQDCQIMLKAFDNISAKIINKTCKPNLNSIKKLFYDCGFGENKEQYEAFEREIFVTIVNIATQILIEGNKIPSPPTQAPWIVWGWTGNIIWDE